MFELRLRLLFRTAALPRLAVEVNGRRGEFLLPQPEKIEPHGVS